MINVLHAAWLRRWWRADERAISMFSTLVPVVVVTGGSEGVGLALAQCFAQAGDRLLLVARDLARLDTAATHLRTECRAQVDVLALDLTDRNALTALDQKLAAMSSYADVVVNNAGIGLSGDFTEHDPAVLARLVDLNVQAVTALTRHYLPGMKIRGRGGILNLASVGSYGPGPNQAAYYASKAYVLSLTEAIAHENAGCGVRICASAPGPVHTRFHAKMGAESALYRWLSPPAPSALVARLSYWGYLAGMRVVWPGAVTPLAALAMRLIPHRILNIIVATLLKPRRTWTKR